MSTYLDAAATAPLLPQARAAMERILDAGNANPSSVHSPGQWAAREVAAARATIARVFGVPDTGVIFTSGGTEANNLGIIGRALADPRGRHILTTRTQHSSVLASCDYLHRLHGFTVEYVPVDNNGQVQRDDLIERLRPDTTLIALDLANGEVGTVTDLDGIPAHLLHLDAVQAAASLPVSLAPDGWPGPHAATMAVASHKFGGPQGVGALVLPQDIPLEPLIHGGNQEHGRRAGTHNVAGICGFAAAVGEHAATVGTRALALMDSRDRLIRAVEKHIPGARLTGHRTERLPGHASFVFPGVSGESLLVALDAAGYAVSSGSACRAGSQDPSPVLIALGYSPEEAHSALRFSLAQPLDDATIAQIVRVLAGEVTQWDKNNNQSMG
ncbi:cysteine desulfurase family protein [Corynebacterium renale]|uniref:Cysteine desulfurase n=1 Tax=Corynebacterium renale TaxID=1724 RepID=A0A2A9DQ67_9CORY|nr:cysteine desulfurase family protein [Corynebacterium renale]PFG28838.1 cysteine desulfurase [Corynebacterium renale]SQI25672.1 cysteine desulfurase [Corynebacterium renale]